MSYGIYGRYADVDLSSRSVNEYTIPRDWIQKYLGGRGIGARILLEELPKEVDPLGEENILIFGTGPFQGTGVAGASRNVVLAVSPVTRAVSDSFVGGFFPHELGQSGYDGLVIRGKSEDPVYILMHSGMIELHDASDIWGKGVLETDDILRTRHKGTRVASIGLAGERGVQFACIMNDVNRAAGRPGFGCVMGSKKLKAVVVAGNKPKDIFDEDQFVQLRQDFTRWIMLDPSTQSRQKYGTAENIAVLNELGILPTKNYQEGVFEGADRISGETLVETIFSRRATCRGCPVACKRVVHTTYHGKEVLEAYGGPEYETLAALGSMCLIDDLSAIALANQKCNSYGLDSIATGVAIAAAMEATERGYLTNEEGIKWGDAHALLVLIDQIAHREGLGSLLGKGMRSLEEEWGSEFVLHVKGQAVPMHDVRAKKGMGISYATSPRGATHMEGFDDEMFIGVKDPTPQLGVNGEIDWLSWTDKAKLCKTYEDLMSFTNSLIMCSHISMNKSVGEYYPYERILDILHALTGKEISQEEMLEIGDRNFCLLKKLALRMGYSHQDDDLPGRFKAPLPSGPCKGERVSNESLKKALSDYYQLRDCASIME